MTLTEEQIAEIRARAEAATPGPWILYDVAFKKPDLDFIKHSRDDIPALLSSLEAQAAELAEVRQQYVDANEARIDAEAALAEARKALGLMLREHDILSGNYGVVCPVRGVTAPRRPDRWPTAAEAARRALAGGNNGE